jgi:hypothetical protein
MSVPSSDHNLPAQLSSPSLLEASNSLRKASQPDSAPSKTTSAVVQIDQVLLPVIADCDVEVAVVVKSPVITAWDPYRQNQIDLRNQGCRRIPRGQ